MSTPSKLDTTCPDLGRFFVPELIIAKFIDPSILVLP